MGGAMPLLTGMTSRLAEGHLYLSLEGQKKIMKIFKQTERRFELDTLQTREEFNH
jgi:predicted DNA repair protein MutK